MDMLEIDGQTSGDALAAALEAHHGRPLFIGRCGIPTHVMLSLDAYRELLNASLSLADALRQDVGMEIEFEPGKLGSFPRVPNL